MEVSLFDYELPKELIAQYPAEERGSSRMMVLDCGNHSVTHRRFSDLPGYLKPADVVVVNRTKVIRARLLGRKSDGMPGVEVFLLRELDRNVWECLVRPGRRLPVGSRVGFDGGSTCEFIARTEFGGRVARFDIEGELLDMLDRVGHVPLPPYIKREDESGLDGERYQTVYAETPGSVAAPTAGLHFTTGMLEELRAKGVRITTVVLHVGLGTFQPVKVLNVEEHRMHREAYSVPQETADVINTAKKEGRRIITVGTTTVRALETAADDGGEVRPGSGESDIFIYPGYKFRVAEALLTNFHLPRSTLLMMVSALAGREFLLEAYREGVKKEYRFYSYGDCMLIL